MQLENMAVRHCKQSADSLLFRRFSRQADDIVLEIEFHCLCRASISKVAGQAAPSMIVVTLPQVGGRPKYKTDKAAAGEIFFPYPDASHESDRVRICRALQTPLNGYGSAPGVKDNI